VRVDEGGSRDRRGGLDGANVLTGNSGGGEDSLDAGFGAGGFGRGLGDEDDGDLAAAFPGADRCFALGGRAGGAAVAPEARSRSSSASWRIRQAANPGSAAAGVPDAVAMLAGMALTVQSLDLRCLKTAGSLMSPC